MGWGWGTLVPSGCSAARLLAVPPGPLANLHSRLSNLGFPNCHSEALCFRTSLDTQEDKGPGAYSFF